MTVYGKYEYEYPGNKVIQKIELTEGEYDPYHDVDQNKVKVYYTNGEQVEWDTTIVEGDWDNPWGIDSNGEVIYGTSLRGIYCVYARTGELKWRSRRWASIVAVNANDTITCEGLQKIFILSPAGKLIKEIKTYLESAINYLNDQFFMIAFSTKAWTIVDAETLSNKYVIPSNVFLSRLRFARKEGNLLYVQYWSGDETGFPDDEDHIIDLSLYACE